MSTRFCIIAFLFASVFVLSIDSQSAISEYVIRKDFFARWKTRGFSINDKSENEVYYRIESKYTVMQNIELYAYPSKQVVGRLQAKVNFLLSKAEFSILDDESNQWINGLILQNYQFLGNLFNIDWNGHRLTMGTEAGSVTWKFRDTNGAVLAQFKIRPSSKFWTNKYDMQIFSTKFPEQIYLLLLAFRDRLGGQ